MSIKEDESLLLFVDVKDILNHKVKLTDTKNWESVETKRKQVGDNIINNSWVLYNNMIDNKIDEEIEKRIPHITKIECNVSNEKEFVMYRLMSKRRDIEEFRKYVISKYDDAIEMNPALNIILKNTNKDYFDKQQQATTKTIKFKGHKPKTFVLKRLEMIASEIDSNESVVFTANKLKQIISEVLDNPDERTSKAYYDCMVDFVKESGGIINDIYRVKFNMRGFSDAVKNSINEKYAN